MDNLSTRGTRTSADWHRTSRWQAALAALTFSCGAVQQPSEADNNIVGGGGSPDDVQAASPEREPLVDSQLPNSGSPTPQSGGQVGEEGGVPSLCAPEKYLLNEQTRLGLSGQQLIASTPKSFGHAIQWPDGSDTVLTFERLDDATHGEFFYCDETVVTVVTYGVKTEDGLLNELAFGRLVFSAEGTGHFSWKTRDDRISGSFSSRDFFLEARCEPVAVEDDAPEPPGNDSSDCPTASLQVRVNHSPSATSGDLILKPFWQDNDLELATW